MNLFARLDAIKAVNGNVTNIGQQLLGGIRLFMLEVEQLWRLINKRRMRLTSRKDWMMQDVEHERNVGLNAANLELMQHSNHTPDR